MFPVFTKTQYSMFFVNFVAIELKIKFDMSLFENILLDAKIIFLGDPILELLPLSHIGSHLGGHLGF